MYHLRVHDPYAHVTRYRQTSNISCTLADNKLVDPSDVVRASLVGAAPTPSSFSIQHLASMDWAKTTARRDETHLSFVIWCNLILEILRYICLCVLSIRCVIYKWQLKSRKSTKIPEKNQDFSEAVWMNSPYQVCSSIYFVFCSSSKHFYWYKDIDWFL